MRKNVFLKLQALSSEMVARAVYIIDYKLVRNFMSLSLTRIDYDFLMDAFRISKVPICPQELVLVYLGQAEFRSVLQQQTFASGLLTSNARPKI